MLKSTLLPVEIAAALAAYTLTSKEAITPLMEQLCREQVGLSCFIEGGFISAEARIETVLPENDALILVAASEVEHDLLAAAKAITVVGLRQGVKIQFSSVTTGAVEPSRDAGVWVTMPTQVLRLQRRVFDRVKPSEIRPLECMVRGQANTLTLRRLPVLDISAGGVALLSRYAGDAYEVGQRLHNCSFELGADGEFMSDLIVRDVERLGASGGSRYGCVFADMEDRARETLRRFIERIEAAKRAKR